MALSAKLQNEIRQFQRLEQDLAVLTQQRVQMDLKLRETVHTLEELKALPEDTVIYRPLGALLVRAKDRKEVDEMLTEDKETLEVRVKALERQETALKERYSQMQREISEQLKTSGLVPAAEEAAASSDAE